MRIRIRALALMGAFTAMTLLAPPGASRLMHEEPFGPVDTIVVVDTEEELLAAMNASNGALVASLAVDDEELGAKLAADVQAFKVGINRPRSRGGIAAPMVAARNKKVNFLVVLAPASRGSTG